jgi:hypothetical protein
VWLDLLRNRKGYIFMQDTKDTFFVALRDRVAALNPGRTVVVRGVVRPGVIVEENELASEFIAAGVFLLRWTELSVNRQGAMPLAELTLSIRYCSDGDADNGGMDRGRLLAQMDAELGKALGGLQHARKTRFAAGGAVVLKTNIFWGDVTFGPVVVVGERMSRVASVTVFGYLGGAS